MSWVNYQLPAPYVLTVFQSAHGVYHKLCQVYSKLYNKYEHVWGGGGGCTMQVYSKLYKKYEHVWGGGDVLCKCTVNFTRSMNMYGGGGVCTMQVYSKHVQVDTTQQIVVTST